MTMFNSRKINTDPTPLYRVFMVARNGRTAEWKMRSNCEDTAIETAMNAYPNYDLHTVSVIRNRAEFDNNPNPVLLAFRDYCTEASASELHRAAALWSDVLSGRSRDETEASLIAAGLMATDAEYAHAERVLARLAARWITAARALVGGRVGSITTASTSPACGGEGGDDEVASIAIRRA